MFFTSDKHIFLWKAVPCVSFFEKLFFIYLFDIPTKMYKFALIDFSSKYVFMKTVCINNFEKIEEIIRSCPFCFVGVADEEGFPYVFPMNFGYENGELFLHSSQQGRKTDILAKNPKICITFCDHASLVNQFEDVACTYVMRSKSVICFGKAVFEEDTEEKIKALNCIMKHYTKRDFSYSAPAVNNVKIWRIKPDKITCRYFGVPYKEALELEKSEKEPVL